MLIDAHAHIYNGPVMQADLLSRLAEAGVDGAVLLSVEPDCFRPGGAHIGAAERIENVLAWCGGRETLFPFFWIDPTEPDATAQVDFAVSEGVRGFKVICGRHMPCDPRAMPVYRRVARHQKPLVFHSGILWDGLPSSEFNRPASFEGLLTVEGLRFSLAHISWPWCDECLAVYGKFQNALSLRKDLSVEMFIDITPGTPPVYRRDALTKLYTIGYDVERNVLFGTDCDAAAYNVRWTRDTVERDDAIYREIGLTKDATDRLYGGNLLRFLGVTDEKAEKKPLLPGQ